MENHKESKKNWGIDPSTANLVAFIGVLFLIGWLAYRPSGTDLAIMTGLVGVLGSFRPWLTASTETKITNTPTEPVPTQPQDK